MRLNVMLYKPPFLKKSVRSHFSEEGNACFVLHPHKAVVSSTLTETPAPAKTPAKEKQVELRQ